MQELNLKTFEEKIQSGGRNRGSFLLPYLRSL